MFKNLFAVVCFCLVGVSPAFGSTLTVNEDIQLTQWNDKTNSFWEFSIFAEEQPGVLSDKLLNDGCSIIVESKQQTLPKGTYDVISDEKGSPDFWDRRFHRNFTLSLPNGDFSVSCKTTQGTLFNPINKKYISNVSNGILVLN